MSSSARNCCDALLQKRENEEIVVGKLIALMVEEGDDWQNVSVPEDVKDDAANRDDDIKVVSDTHAKTESSAQTTASSHL